MYQTETVLSPDKDGVIRFSIHLLVAEIWVCDNIKNLAWEGYQAIIVVKNILSRLKNIFTH